MMIIPTDGRVKNDCHCYSLSMCTTLHRTFLTTTPDYGTTHPTEQEEGHPIVTRLELTTPTRDK
jgi:hypothetical protein